MLARNWDSAAVLDACEQLRKQDGETGECEDCAEWLVEAWERMTQGGVVVTNHAGAYIRLVRSLLRNAFVDATDAAR